MVDKRQPSPATTRHVASAGSAWVWVELPGSSRGRAGAEENPDADGMRSRSWRVNFSRSRSRLCGFCPSEASLPMSEQTGLSPVGELVLARLLAAGDKGVTGGEIRKALEPSLGHRWTGAALRERIEATLTELATAGLVARVRKGKSVRDFLTPEGRLRVLEILGLDQLPPKITWDRLKKTYLVGPGVGTPLAERGRGPALRYRQRVQGRAAEGAVRAPARFLPRLRGGARRAGLVADRPGPRAEVQRQERSVGLDPACPRRSART